MTGFIALCGVLGKLHEINLSDCHLGPASAGELAKAVSSADAAVKKINLSGCPLTGAEKTDGNWYEIDSDMTGFIALCGVLGKLHEINMSDCGLGAASAGEFAKAVSDADAALAVLNISGAFTPFTSSLLSPVHPIDQLTLITGIYYYSPYLPR